MKERIDIWIKEVIIGLNLCPFAKLPFESGKIRTSISDVTDDDKMFEFFLDELEIIQAKIEISNSLVCFSKYNDSFEQFYDFVNHCEHLLVKLNLDHLFQLVCFHPNFKFANSENSQRVNLVNSSPCPLIHILRTNEVENATKSISDPETITNNNEIKLTSLSNENVEKFFPWKSN